MMAGSNQFATRKQARSSQLPPYVYGGKKKSSLYVTLLMLFSWWRQKRH